MAPKRQRLVIEGPYAFEKTLEPTRMGKYDPTGREIEGRHVRTTHTPDGPGTIALAWDRSASAIEAEAWGPGADHLLAGLAAYTGADDDPTAWVPTDERFVRAQRRCPGIRMIRVPNVFHVLVQVVLQQRVTWRDAASSYRKLVTKHGEPAPGPFDLRLPPTAAVFGRLDEWAYREAGVEKKRGETIRRAAISARRIEETLAMPLAAASKRFEAFRGIGPWTSNFLRASALGDADAVPVGDLHLPHYVTQVLAGEPRGSDERMLELLEPYRPHRWRAVRLLRYV